MTKALRNQVWLTYFGKSFEHKCYKRKNKIDVFNFHVGHNVPESKGDPAVLENLIRICASCNLSIYTIDKWNKLGSGDGGYYNCFF